MCRRTEVFKGANDAQGVGRVAGNEIGAAQGTHRARLRAEIDQDTAAASPVSGLNIIENITDQPGARKIDIQIGGGGKQHAGCWFAAGAANRQFRDYAFWMVRTVIDTIKPHTALLKLTCEVLVHEP